MTFTYCGKAPEDFGCYYIPDEDQISDMMSEYEQFAEDFEARDGGYYFGDRQPPKEFDLPCYYEDIDKKTMEQIVRWLDRRTSGRLVFDERPDVYYDVVPSAKIEFEDYSYTKYGKTLHAGEFTIHFTAYDPFGKLTKKFLRTGEEMDYSTNLIPETQMPPAPSVTDTSFLVYNPGTERTGLILRVAGDASNGQVVKNTTNGQELALLPFNQAVTTTAGKWFEIDSKKGQVYLVGAATRELAFEYHDKGYIALEANLGFEDGKIISFSQGGNTVTATDDENGFSEDDIGKYIYTGDGWHKILSVSDVTIVDCGKNLLPINTSTSTSLGITTASNNDGTYTVNGTSTGYGSYDIDSHFSYLNPGKTYTLSGGKNGVKVLLTVSNADGFVRNHAVSTNGNAATFVAEDLADGEYNRIVVQCDPGTTVDNVTIYPQLEAGDTATAFEPYQDIPFLALDNAQGQIESVAVEAGCRAKQAGTGDPSPENIRAITGRESVEIAACGKNLFDINDREGPQGQASVEWDENGWITISANNTNGGSVIYGNYFTAASSVLRPNTNYIIAYELVQADISGPVGLAVIGNHPGSLSQFTQDWSIVIDSSRMGTHLALRTTTSDFANADYMLRTFVHFNPGSSGTVKFRLSVLQYDPSMTAETFVYEPYRSMGGGTVVPTEPLYGLLGAEDTVEVSVDGDVLVTRRTNALVLDGTENWTLSENTSAGAYRFNMSNVTPAPKLTGNNALAQAYLCSHYAFLSSDATWSGNRGVSFASAAANLQVCDMDYADVPAWKAYLAAQYAAGTPVTIVYELAAPETEALTAISPIAPQPGQLNLATDADSLNITLYKKENNKYASVTGSFSQTQNGFASMLAQMNEISILGEDAELTKLEIDYVPQVR